MYFFIFILLFTFTYSYSIIRLPFKRKIPDSKNITSDNFANIFFESNYYTEITIGSTNQKLPMRLSFGNYHTFITISKYTGNFTKYDPLQSATYQKTYGERIFSNINIIRGINSKEKFTLKTINNKDIFCNNIDFILATIPKMNISGDFGMSLSTKDEYLNRLLDFSFITNLYNKNYIKYKIFSINFFNKNEGEIIIGGKANEYSNYDIGYFIEDYIPVNKNGYFWGLLNLVSSLNGNNLFFQKQSAIFSIESYVIKPHYSYIEKINELFFNEQLENKKCIFVNKSIDYSFYHCDKNINLKNFPTLYLYQRIFNYTFELNSKDLFEDIGERKYFLMNFADDDSNDKWVLGQPFLKKYNFTYNFDTKTVGMYFGLNEEKKTKKTEKDGKKYVVIWIIVIIICLVIIIILGKVKFSIVKKVPKEKVNELEIFFKYEEKKDNIEKNNINDKNNINN